MMSQSLAIDGAGDGDPDPIVTAAIAVLSEVGPTRLTLAAVARRAGVSRMTVYRRYPSVDAVVAAALTAEMDGVVRRAMSEQFSGNNRERVVGVTASGVRALVDHTLLQRVLQVDPQSLLPLLVERIGSGQRLVRDYLTVALEAGMASRGGDGSIREADPRLMALVVLTMAQPYVVGMRPLSQEYPQEVLLAEMAAAINSYLKQEDQ